MVWLNPNFWDNLVEHFQVLVYDKLIHVLDDWTLNNGWQPTGEYHLNIIFKAL